MKQAALLLAGKHDFKKFSTVKKNKSTEKEILNIDIYEDLEEIQITLEATDFLHNMPRMILSTLLDIGLGIRRKEEIDEILSPTSSTVASAPCDERALSAGSCLRSLKQLGKVSCTVILCTYFLNKSTISVFTYYHRKGASFL